MRGILENTDTGASRPGYKRVKYFMTGILENIDSGASFPGYRKVK